MDVQSGSAGLEQPGRTPKLQLVTQAPRKRGVDRRHPHVRMLPFVEMVTESGCWIYLGCLDQTGYAMVWTDEGSARGHRVMYEYHRGPIPEGLTLDHLCRVRCCVNPWHMEAVTLRENILRGASPWVAWGKRTECHKCHGPLIPKSKGPGRYCVACYRKYQRDRWPRRAAAHQAAQNARRAIARSRAIEAAERQLAVADSRAHLTVTK